MFSVFYAVIRFAKGATILPRFFLYLTLSFITCCLPSAAFAQQLELSYSFENEQHIFDNAHHKIHFNTHGEIVFFELHRENKYKMPFIPEQKELELSFPNLSQAPGVRISHLEKQDILTNAITSFTRTDDAINFTAQLPADSAELAGLQINKTWTFTDEYQLELKIQLHNPTEQEITLDKENFGLLYSVVADFDYWTSCVYGTNRENIKKLSTDLKSQGQDWTLAAYRSQFFVLALQQKQANQLFFTQLPSAKQQQPMQDLARFFIPFGLKNLSPKETINKEYHFYLGEKREETMVNNAFAPLFDKYGVWFGAIEKPLFILLSFFYELTASYGLAILLLTLLVKIVLLPLNIKQVRSMAKMQQIQPELRRIQEEFKDDKQKQSQEMMRLYQLHNVNPLAGCLPLLLQMPIFFALFYTVGGSVEMYGERFLWLKDLALRDPTEILPILFVASFLWSQRKMMGDPNQKMMMLMMPVLFFFMMRQLPAGVMLYIVGQSVFSAIEQVVVPRPGSPACATGTTKAGADDVTCDIKTPNTEENRPKKKHRRKKK